MIAHMAEAVIAVEDDEAMAQEAQDALAQSGSDNVMVHTGPLSEGAPKHGPYDVIIIEGGVVEVPQELTDQLKDGGRIAAIFIKGALGEVRVGHKRDDHVSWRMTFNAGAPVLEGFTRESAFQL